MTKVFHDDLEESRQPSLKDLSTASLLNQAGANFRLVQDREFEPADVRLLITIYDQLIRPILIEKGGLDGYDL